MSLVGWMKGEESDATLLEIVSMIATSIDADTREVFNVQQKENFEEDYALAWRLLELCAIIINEKMNVENFGTL